MTFAEPIRSATGFSRKRPAFSLIELLVVMGIIGLLAALVAAAVSKVIPAQQQRNTTITLRKLNGMLQSHWRAVIEDAKEEVRLNKHTSVSSLAGDPERAKVLWIKLRLVQQFPMSYQEALYPGYDFSTGSPDAYIGRDATYTRTLQAAGLTRATVGAPNLNNWLPQSLAAALRNQPPTPSLEENAACLVMALTARSHRSVKNEIDEFNVNERSLLANGLPILVDNWGRPLAFFRWPIGNPEVQNLRATSGAAAQFPDPTDTVGSLMAPGWNAATNLTTVLTAERLIKHSLHQGSGSSWTRVPFYMLPVVVSSGQDDTMGLDYWMTPDNNYSNDNTYTFTLR